MLTAKTKSLKAAFTPYEVTFTIDSAEKRRRLADAQAALGSTIGNARRWGAPLLIKNRLSDIHALLTEMLTSPQDEQKDVEY